MRAKSRTRGILSHGTSAKILLLLYGAKRRRLSACSTHAHIAEQQFAVPRREIRRYSGAFTMDGSSITMAVFGACHARMSYSPTVATPKHWGCVKHASKFLRALFSPTGIMMLRHWSIILAILAGISTRYSIGQIMKCWGHRIVLYSVLTGRRHPNSLLAMDITPFSCIARLLN